MDRTSVISRAQTNIPMPAHMPASAHLPMPSLHGIGGIGDSGSASSMVTPTTVVQRLPSIVNPTPTDVSGAACDAFTLWVSQNPLWALGGLAVIAYFAIVKGK